MDDTKNYSNFEVALRMAKEPENAEIEVELQILENDLIAQGNLSPYEINAVCRLKKEYLLESRKKQPDQKEIDRLESAMFDILHGGFGNVTVKFNKDILGSIKEDDKFVN